ncbi:MAG: YlxR family protein [Proteobacteria bacterium]|nr:YlxR family protein [Pseudomonadota bacterium]
MSGDGPKGTTSADGQAAGAAGPVRMCCICRCRLPQAQLLRHVRAAKAGEEQEAGKGFVPDPRRRMPGRGLYVCDRAECRERFLRRGDGRKKR